MCITLSTTDYKKEVTKLEKDFEQERNAPKGFVEEEKRVKLLLDTNKKDLEESFTELCHDNVEKYTKEMNALVEEDKKKKAELGVKKDLLRLQYKTVFEGYSAEYTRFGNKDIHDALKPALSLLKERLSDGDKTEKALSPQLLLVELVSWSSTLESELGASIEQSSEGRKHVSDVLSEAKKQLKARILGENEMSENDGNPIVIE